MGFDSICKYPSLKLILESDKDIPNILGKGGLLKDLFENPTVSLISKFIEQSIVPENLVIEELINNLNKYEISS